MQHFPFAPWGNSFIITTSASTSTSQQTPIILPGSGNLNIPSASPSQIRIYNSGTGPVWFAWSLTLGSTIAIPTAGTTTLGTPQPVMWIGQGEDSIFSVPIPPNIIGATAQLGIYLNTISTVASQSLYCQFGEGL
jgi:hypothetical protein